MMQNSNNATVLEYLGNDFLKRPTYKLQGYQAYLKDMELGRGSFGSADLYFTNPIDSMFGDPDFDAPYDPPDNVVFVSRLENGSLPSNARVSLMSMASMAVAAHADSRGMSGHDSQSRTSITDRSF